MDEKVVKEKQETEKERTILPFNFRVQQARNYLRLSINTAAVEYGLDGSVLGLIVESLLEEEYKQQIAFMAEQTDSMINGIQEEN